MKTHKIDYFKWAFIITIILTVVLIIVYVVQFHGTLSSIHSDFADFGSYLGSITGLLAFAGVLYTIRESQKSDQIDNERTTFYNLLGLYQRQVDTIKYINDNTEKIGIEAFKEYANEARCLFYAHIMYYHIKSGKELPKEIIPDVNEKHFWEICRKYQVSSFSELRAIFIYHLEEGPLASLQFVYDIKDIIKSTDFNTSYHLAVTSICNRMIFDDKQYHQIYEIIRHTGDYLYGQYGRYLGQYYRNIYYLLNSLVDFKFKNDYSKIFRAQLSLDELTILLFNSMNYRSTRKTIFLLKEFDIFNNIDPDQLALFGYTVEEEKKSEIINLLFQEFRNDPENR